jgi:hypothetical protein
LSGPSNFSWSKSVDATDAGQLSGYSIPYTGDALASGAYSYSVSSNLNAGTGRNSSMAEGLFTYTGASTTALYASFTGQGLWKYDGSWTQVNTVVPASMLVSGTTLYMSFTGQGLWKYDGSWTRLNTVVPASMLVSGTTLYASFTGQGLWKYDGSWTQVNTVVPASMLVSGTTLYMSFTGQGLWKYDGSWTQINTVVPESMVIVY